VAAGAKSPDAFKTIGELSQELGVAQHILRYWETRFPQLKPMQRAGNRRYYRPDDVELVRKIHHLLNDRGFTVRGVQRLLKSPSLEPEQAPTEPTPDPVQASPSLDIGRLVTIRDRLSAALDS
jgi:DNA-binding transcriptional MerR regulator